MVAVLVGGIDGGWVVDGLIVVDIHVQSPRSKSGSRRRRKVREIPAVVFFASYLRPTFLTDCIARLG